MAASVVHIIESARPRAGCVDGQVVGLIDALQAHGLGGRLVAVNAAATMVLSDSNAAGSAWHACPPAQLQALLEQAALVHVHAPEPQHFGIIAKLTRACRRPVVISPHASLSPHPWRRVGLLARLKGWLERPARRWHFARALLAANPEEAAELQAIHRCVDVLPVGITPQTPTPQPGTWLREALGAEAHSRRCLLFLGPLHPLQGLVPMLKACELVVPAAPDWHLVMAGPTCGSWLDMIRPAVERRGLSKRVSFVMDPDVVQQQELLQHCEVVIQPSLLPSPPISAMCGLLHARPCVVSRRCHLVEEDLAWAWQSEPRKDALASTLEGALAHTPAEHGRMGAAGHQWVVQQRSWTALAPAYAGFYHQWLD